jgi:hypothetical protein
MDRGSTVAGGNRRRVQVRQARRGGWTKAERQRFLDALAATCNVTASCAAAGLSTNGAYKLRKRDPAFAALWIEAIAIGYERLEEAMLRYALGTVNALAINPDRPGPLDGVSDGSGKGEDSGGGLQIGAVRVGDLQVALQLLHRYAETAKNGGSMAQRTVAAASAAETDAYLRQKLDSLAKRMHPDAG